MDLYHNPAELFMASSIGSPAMNFIEGKASGIDSLKFELEPESVLFNCLLLLIGFSK